MVGTARVGACIVVSLAITQSLGLAYGQSLQCVTERKFGSAGEIPKEQMDLYKPYSRLFAVDDSVVVQRCSFSPSAQRNTCDTYQVDKVETDQHAGISKYYYFRGQFDLQIFPDGSFVENNGRGMVSFGHCVDE